MRIAQLSPYYFPHHGGVESFVRDMSLELTQMGHDVTIITSRFDSSLPLSEEKDGVHIRRVPLLGTLLRTPLARKLPEQFRTGRFDIVHSHTPPPSFAFTMARRLRKMQIPTVVTYHCDSDIPSRLVSPFVRFVDRFVSRRIIGNATKVLVTTKTYSSTSSNTWKIVPEIVPVSADTRRFHPDKEDRKSIRKRFNLEGKKAVLFVGRLVRHKGVQFLIDSMRYLDGNTVLLVVGDGEFSHSLSRLAKSYGLEKKVIMLGDVPDSILPSLYRAADVVVVPSTSRLEAFSIAAIEAMASSTPVLVSNIPGVREVIEDSVHGLRSEPMDSRNIAEKLREMLSDENRLKSMGVEGVKRAATFSSAAVAKTMLSIYEKMLGSDDLQ